MVHVVYAYRPLSLWSLGKLLEYEVYGEKAVVQRYQARMLWAGAVGVHYDKTLVPCFGRQLDDIYQSPFNRRISDENLTGEQIINRLLERG